MYSLNNFNKKDKTRIAGIVADLIGDGHLQNPPKNRFDYTSKYKKELNRFGKEIYDLFKIEGKIRKCTTNKYGTCNYGVNNTKLALFLNSIGVPGGNKVLKHFMIPHWIIEDKKFFARFINRLFSCEASVDVPSKAIEFKMYKSIDLIPKGIKFFNQIKDDLERFYKIRATNPFLTGSSNLRKDGIMIKGIRIKIKNKESLRNYHKYIGFEDKNKQKKLKKIVE